MLLLKAVGLGKVFHPRTAEEHRALSGLYASLQSGSCLGVLGMSGAGKTTLCRLLAGLLSPTQGGVQYFGPDGPLAARPPIGYIAPGVQPSLALTPREWILSWVAGVGASAGKADLFTEEFSGLQADIGDWNAPCSRVSAAGRLAMLRTLIDIVDPPCVIIDDPVPAGDASAQDLVEWVCDLTRHGKAVLWATSFPDRVERHAHEVILLDHGLAVAKGAVEEWKRRSFSTTLEAAVHWHLDQHRSLLEEGHS
ncbi:MAG: ATP-binding cassette domain-containing protein [Planctomycetes bacterium]|nr:ATP-binding cassette domain-containing protein [Planctomycetota bacterium]